MVVTKCEIIKTLGQFVQDVYGVKLKEKTLAHAAQAILSRTHSHDTGYTVVRYGNSVSVAPARYRVGQTVRLKPGRVQLDSDHESSERYTLGGTLGEITSVNFYDSQGWTYNIVFRNGGWLVYMEHEIPEELEVLN